MADTQPSCCLQVSVSGQALVFVVRTSGWSITSRAGLFTYIAFFAAQASLWVSRLCLVSARSAPACCMQRRKQVQLRKLAGWAIGCKQRCLVYTLLALQHAQD